MVIIPFYHCLYVIFPAISEITAIVETGLSDIPHVKGFINYIHSVVVAGRKHVGGSRIVGRADCIKSLLFQNSHSSPFALCKAGCAEYSIVMMNAKERLFSIYKKTFITPGNLSDAKLFIGFIHNLVSMLKHHMSFVKIW